jgi:hypothetical protein
LLHEILIESITLLEMFLLIGSPFRYVTRQTPIRLNAELRVGVVIPPKITSYDLAAAVLEGQEAMFRTSIRISPEKEVYVPVARQQASSIILHSVTSVVLITPAWKMTHLSHF